MVDLSTKRDRQYDTIEDPVIQKFVFEIQVFAKAEVSDLRSFVSTRNGAIAKVKDDIHRSP